MNNNKNGSFKPKKVYFSQVSNYALRDNTLSLKAKGLYSLIQSYITIENFVLYKNTLKKVCLEGNTAFESGWKELKDKGYLIQEKHQNPDGTFYYIYDLLDIPIQTPKTEGMDNADDGYGGSYNNTDLNNTDLNNTYSNNYLHNPLDCDRYCYLSEIDNEFVQSYLAIMKPYRPPHKRVKKENIDYILNAIELIRGSGFELPDWEQAVHEYFTQLPSSNDGDIIAFLSASMRYFNVDVNFELGR